MDNKDFNLLDMFVGIAVDQGDLSEADAQSLHDIQERPRIAVMLNNYLVKTIGNEPLYWKFKRDCLEPLLPWLDQETTEREARERHARVIAAQVAANREAEDRAQAKVAAQDAADLAERRFTQRFRALPPAIMPYLRARVRAEAAAKKLEEAERAHREARRHQSVHGNLVIKG